jgi:hypothetical protein
VTCRSFIAWRRPSGLAAVLCLALLATACSSKNKKEAKGPACPSVGVLADAAQLAQFASTENAGDLVFRAEMVNAAASCDYSRKHVDLALAVQVHAIRGSAGGPSVHPSRYFVAVVDAQERILAREFFSLPIVFENTRQQAVLRDTVDRVRIPVKSKEAGATYQVIVGFELTPDQVIYNRVTSGQSRNGT